MKRFLIVIFTSISGGLFGEGFFPGTLVKTIHGFLSIEKLVAGDLIIGTDLQGSWVEGCVTAVKREQTDTCMMLVIDYQIIIVAHDHLFYVSDEKKWIPARALIKGQKVLKNCHDGSTVMMVKEIPFKIDLYTLSVEQHHNFCVSKENIHVHNYNSFERNENNGNGYVSWDLIHANVRFTFTKGEGLSVGFFGSVGPFMFGKKLFDLYKHDDDDRPPSDPPSDGGGSGPFPQGPTIFYQEPPYKEESPHIIDLSKTCDSSSFDHNQNDVGSIESNISFNNVDRHIDKPQFLSDNKPFQTFLTSSNPYSPHSLFAPVEHNRFSDTDLNSGNVLIGIAAPEARRKVHDGINIVNATYKSLSDAFGYITSFFSSAEKTQKGRTKGDVDNPSQQKQKESEESLLIDENFPLSDEIKFFIDGILCENTQATQGLRREILNKIHTALKAVGAGLEVQAFGSGIQGEPLDLFLIQIEESLNKKVEAFTQEEAEHYVRTLLFIHIISSYANNDKKCRTKIDVQGSEVRNLLIKTLNDCFDFSLKEGDSANIDIGVTALGRLFVSADIQRKSSRNFLEEIEKIGATILENLTIQIGDKEAVLFIDFVKELVPYKDRVNPEQAVISSSLESAIASSFISSTEECSLKSASSFLNNMENESKVDVSCIPSPSDTAKCLISASADVSHQDTFSPRIDTPPVEKEEDIDCLANVIAKLDSLELEREMVDTAQSYHEPYQQDVLDEAYKNLKVTQEALNVLYAQGGIEEYKQLQTKIDKEVHNVIRTRNRKFIDDSLSKIERCLQYCVKGVFETAIEPLLHPIDLIIGLYDIAKLANDLTLRRLILLDEYYTFLYSQHYRDHPDRKRDIEQYLKRCDRISSEIVSATLKTFEHLCTDATAEERSEFLGKMAGTFYFGPLVLNYLVLGAVNVGIEAGKRAKSCAFILSDQAMAERFIIALEELGAPEHLIKSTTDLAKITSEAERVGAALSLLHDTQDFVGAARTMYQPARLAQEIAFLESNNLPVANTLQEAGRLVAYFGLGETQTLSMFYEELATSVGEAHAKSIMRFAAEIHVQNYVSVSDSLGIARPKVLSYGTLSQAEMLHPSNCAQRISHGVASGESLEPILQEIGTNLGQHGPTQEYTIVGYIDELGAAGVAEGERERIIQVAIQSTSKESDHYKELAKLNGELTTRIRNRTLEQVCTEIKELAAKNNSTDECLRRFGQKAGQEGIPFAKKFLHEGIPDELVHKALKESYDTAKAVISKGSKEEKIFEKISEELGEFFVNQVRNGHPIDINIYKEAIRDIKTFEDAIEYFGKRKGVIGKDGPLTRIIKEGLKEKPNSNSIKGSLYELEKGLEWEKKGIIVEELSYHPFKDQALKEIINAEDWNKLIKKYNVNLEYDIKTAGKLIECKKINWKHMTENLFDFDDKRDLAVQIGMSYELHSLNPIPEIWKNKLISYGINFVEDITK